MAIIQNLTSRVLLVPLDRKRHVALAVAGDPGDSIELDDRHLVADERRGNIIEQLVKRGDLAVLPGGQGYNISSVAVGPEQFPGMHGIETWVDLAGSVGVDVPIPYAAVTDLAMVLSVQSNVDEEIAAGGTSVAYGIGIGVADPDKYGLSAGLGVNTKTNYYFVPPLAPTGAPEILHISMVTALGAAGDTPATAGKVHLRISWLDAPLDLASV